MPGICLSNETSAHCNDHSTTTTKNKIRGQGGGGVVAVPNAAVKRRMPPEKSCQPQPLPQHDTATCCISNPDRMMVHANERPTQIALRATQLRRTATRTTLHYNLYNILRLLELRQRRLELRQPGRRIKGGRAKHNNRSCAHRMRRRACLGAKGGEHGEVAAEAEELHASPDQVPRLRLRQHGVKRRRRTLVCVVRAPVDPKTQARTNKRGEEQGGAGHVEKRSAPYRTLEANQMFRTIGNLLSVGGAESVSRRERQAAYRQQRHRHRTPAPN